MSRAADAERDRRRRAALPGGPRDALIAVLKLALPAAAGALLIALALLPLLGDREFSFLLSKDSAEQAGERLRIRAAMYRGETNDGRPFEVSAADAVQKTSDTPVVLLTRMEARLQEEDGPASIMAPSGRYDMTSDVIEIDGPVEVRSASGYSLDGDRVLVNLRARTVTSAEPVTGRLPMGSFAADSFAADVRGRRVLLEGGARLRITPGRGTGGA